MDLDDRFAFTGGNVDDRAIQDTVVGEKGGLHFRSPQCFGTGDSGRMIQSSVSLSQRINAQTSNAMQTECKPEQCELEAFGRREVAGVFGGG